MLILKHQQQAAVGNIVGKQEISRNEQFLLFPQCFLLDEMIESPFVHNFYTISLFVAVFESLKSAYLVKGYHFCFIPILRFFCYFHKT